MMQLNDLSKESENGRMFRLLVKLGFVNERPEVDGVRLVCVHALVQAVQCVHPSKWLVQMFFFQDAQWSETGDRYLLKLFRDFVFHQTREDGAPITDWGHVIEALNKVMMILSEMHSECTSCSTWKQYASLISLLVGCWGS